MILFSSGCVGGHFVSFPLLFWEASILLSSFPNAVDSTTTIQSCSLPLDRSQPLFGDDHREQWRRKQSSLSRYLWYHSPFCPSAAYVFFRTFIVLAITALPYKQSDAHKIEMIHNLCILLDIPSFLGQLEFYKLIIQVARVCLIVYPHAL